VEAAERGRALVLAETLALRTADLARLSALGRDDLRLRLEALLARRFEGGSGAADALSQLRDEIRQVNSFERFMAPMGYSEIAALAGDRCLVYLLPGADRGLALVVAGGEALAVPLPGLTEKVVLGLVQRHIDASSDDAPPRKRDLIARVLGRCAVRPLLTGLPAGTPVTFLPGGLLALLPLHAAEIERGGLRRDHRYLCDLRTVSYLPSARAIRDPVVRFGDRSLLMGPGLPRKHVNLIREFFPAVNDDLSTIDEAERALGEPGLVHVDCHGTADLGSPLQSAIQLGDGWLDLGRLLQLRVRARLVVLAACETALVGTRLPDEAIGLPTGLLQAGAAACIGSLWPVPQVSTAILMAFFYGSSGRVSRPRMPSGARRSGCATRPTAS
jgi:hypothetical protein